MKKIVRFKEAGLIHYQATRNGDKLEWQRPGGIVKAEGCTLGDFERIGPIDSVEYNRDGSVRRMETSKAIYVQVKEEA